MEEKLKELETIAGGLHDAAKKLTDSPFSTLLKEDAVQLYHDLGTALEHIKALFTR